MGYLGPAAIYSAAGHHIMTLKRNFVLFNFHHYFFLILRLPDQNLTSTTTATFQKMFFTFKPIIYKVLEFFVEVNATWFLLIKVIHEQV